MTHKQVCENAAGASSSRDLTRLLGFDLPVRPIKGYSITIPMDAFRSTPRVPVIDDVLHAAVVPIGRHLRGVPILGETPVENLYINTGHGHLGWTMAAGSGKAVADLIAGKPSAIELSDYTLARFRPPR